MRWGPQLKGPSQGNKVTALKENRTDPGLACHGRQVEGQVTDDGQPAFVNLTGFGWSARPYGSGTTSPVQVYTAVLASFDLTAQYVLRRSHHVVVQAGASVTFDASDDQVRVTWTANQNGDHLFVNVTGDATGNYQLGQVGATLIIKNGGDALDTSLDNTVINTDADPSNGDELTITITAVKGNTKTVIISRTDTI